VIHSIKHKNLTTLIQKISIMKLQIIKSLLFAIFLALSLIACTSTGITKQPVNIVNSKKIVFSNIITQKITTGFKVSGNIRLKAISGRRTRLPGHIHVLLKNDEGKILETIKASTHRKYRKIWHFDGVLKTFPSIGNIVVVKYH